MKKNLLAYLAGAGRAKVLVLLAAVVGAALLEVLSVASIMPFMAYLANPVDGGASQAFSSVTQLTQGMDRTSALALVGGLTLFLIIASNLAALGATWLLLRFVNMQSYVVSTRLLASYLSQPYEFFLQTSTSALQKNLISEVRRVTSAVLLPMLQLASKLVVLALMIGLLFVVQPIVSLVSVLAIGTVYGVIFVVIRRTLNIAGREMTASEEQRFKIASEALGGIKEVKIAHLERYFGSQFQAQSLRYFRSSIKAEVITTLPRYVLEMIAFGGIVVIALYLVMTKESATDALPILALYAFAGYRLLPAVQQIYSNFAMIRTHSSALELLSRDLQLHNPGSEVPPSQEMPFLNILELRGISFSYGPETAAIKDVSVEIERHTTVGFVGRSGAGKTTLIDIVLGLLRPNAGQLLADGTPIVETNLRSWQAVLAYVPQQIYLTDSSIASNVAFGLPADQIDEARVREALSLANLLDFVEGLPDGLATRVGERGVRLSGGQRQRIGIARALYRRPEVLILDEATSALDSITEQAVIEAIDRISGKITIIIIAHRINSLKHAHRIHVMEAGSIVQSGSYQQLLDSSSVFRSLVNTRSLEAE